MGGGEKRTNTMTKSKINGQYKIGNIEEEYHEPILRRDGESMCSGTVGIFCPTVSVY